MSRRPSWQTCSTPAVLLIRFAGQWDLDLATRLSLPRRLSLGRRHGFLTRGREAHLTTARLETKWGQSSMLRRAAPQPFSLDSSLVSVLTNDVDFGDIAGA